MKISHAPEGYVCPICVGLEHPGSEETLIKPGDFVYRDELVSVFVNSFFVGENKGHVVVVPNAHVENLYELSDALGARVMQISREVAVAMKKAYGCNGITIRQNNEPAGDQHAFHYHMHVFPRYEDDGYNEASGSKYLAGETERKEYAEKMKVGLSNL